MADRLVEKVAPKNYSLFHEQLRSRNILDRQLHHGLGRIESCYKACPLTFVALKMLEHEQEHKDHKWRDALREQYGNTIKENYVRLDGCLKVLDEKICRWCLMPNKERDEGSRDI